MNHVPLFVSAAFAFTLTVVSVEGSSPMADLFETSFENDESPAYSVGTIFRIKGWHRAGTTFNDSAMIIQGGDDDAPATPHGTQMLRLTNAKDGLGNLRGAPFASYNFARKQTPERLSFSGMTGFSGDLSDKTKIISRFYLSNEEKGLAFHGAAFGIWREKGVLRFFYTGDRGYSTASFGEATLLPGKMYRFELDVRVPERTYRIRVFDADDGTLLASADDGRFRNDVPLEVNYLRLNNLSDPSGNNDDFVSYFDRIRISTDSLFDW